MIQDDDGWSEEEDPAELEAQILNEGTVRNEPTDDDEETRAMFGCESRSNAGKRPDHTEVEESIFDSDEDSEGEEGESDNRLKTDLTQMPGFNPSIMGFGIKSLPAAFETALPGTWITWSDTGFPFRPGEEPIPARTLAINCKKKNFANDAQRLGDFETHTDPVSRASSIATSALIGMLTTGTSKGWLCSPNHSELQTPKAREMEGEEKDKLKKKLQGNIRAYTYAPNSKSSDVRRRDDTAMQFGWNIEEVYNRSGTEVCFYRIYKQVYDHGHSDDELWRQLMNESSEIKRAGTINGVPETLRSAKMMQQNKLQRLQTTDDDMEITAPTQYKRICDMSDLVKFYLVYSGKSDGTGGRPLYGDIGIDTPIGCQAKPFTQDPTMGGKHALGPSVAFNFKRFLAPGVRAPYRPGGPAHPGVNVATAGCVDNLGKPVEIHPSQANPNNYYDSEGRFRPPEWVRQKGCFHVCHDVNIRNIFNLPFPRPVNGSVVPEDCLLEMYWDLKKGTDPRLLSAIENGSRKDPPCIEFRDHEELVTRLFHNMLKERDEGFRKISEGVLDTEMLTSDSIDKSVAEQERLNDMRCYRSKSTKEGNQYVLEPQQVLLDLSEEQERVHDMIDQWNKKEQATIDAKEAQRERGFNKDTAKLMRVARHSAATDACVRLGLRRFENAYASKKLSSSIPPGWKDVAHRGLHDALKACAEFGMRKAVAGTGHRIDPEDPNAAKGTANVAFAHGRKAVARDLSPFGVWRMFLIHLFSSGVKVSGPDVKIVLECWLHAMEPFQEVSFFYLMCGGPGAGKSMRAKRLQALLADGWIKGSGSSSAKAGMNGGMDHLCGRLVYYDEITNDFGSNDSERIEYLKSITMEQHVNNTRTVKSMGTNGMESFVTVVLNSLHYESHLMSTNCGPLGLKADVEPSTNRAALSDRSWAHITHAAEDDGETADVDFDVVKASDEVKEMINQLRVCSCLIAYVLIFIKEIPHCRPNLAFASLLTNKWDSILWNEYNLPRPSKRKRIKRRMMFEMFAVEAAVAEKFFTMETAVAYRDMQPNADGTLSAFCIDQLVDVVRALQRCLDHETIVNAWSHNLDHSPPTCAHVFQMKTVLAQLHGSGLDYHTFAGAVASDRPGGSGGAAQGRPSAPSNLEDLDDDALHTAMEQAEATARDGPIDMYGTGEHDPIVSPTAANGARVCTELKTHSMMQNGMTRGDCGRLTESLEVQRQMRSEYSRRLEKYGVRDELFGNATALERITKVFRDGLDRDGVFMHRMSSNDRVVDAAHAAACLMPTPQDVLSGGVSDQFLKDMIEGKGSNACGGDLRMLGISDDRGKAWDFECTSNKTGSRGPADYDFNWAMLNAFTRSKNDDGGDSVSAKRKKSTWTNVARQIKQSVRTGGQWTRAFSLMDIESMTFESMRDTLFLIAQPLSENKVRVAKHNFSQMQMMKKQSRMLAENEEFGEDDLPATVHPQGMYATKTANGSWRYDPGFVNPQDVKRLSDGDCAPSDAQKRLDHFSDRHALASCVTPTTFEKASLPFELASFRFLPNSLPHTGPAHQGVRGPQRNLLQQVGRQRARGHGGRGRSLSCARTGRRRGELHEGPHELPSTVRLLKQPRQTDHGQPTAKARTHSRRRTR